MKLSIHSKKIKRVVLKNSAKYALNTHVHPPTHLTHLLTHTDTDRKTDTNAHTPSHTHTDNPQTDIDRHTETDTHTIIDVAYIFFGLMQNIYS